MTNLEYWCIKAVDIMGGENIRLVMEDASWLYVWKESKYESLKDWLMAEYKPYKLTQFESDVLHSFLVVGNSEFNLYPPLMRMNEMGYFKNVDTTKTIKEILVNSEVISDD